MPPQVELLTENFAPWETPCQGSWGQIVSTLSALHVVSGSAKYAQTEMYTTKVNSINVLQQQHFVPKLTK